MSIAKSNNSRPRGLKPKTTETVIKLKALQNKLWNHTYLFYLLVRLLDCRWNRFYPSLNLLHKKLDELGFVYRHGTVIFVDPPP
jgi:hypothetical protein